PLKTNMLGGQLKSGQSFDPQLAPLLFTPVNLHSLSLLINANLIGDHTALHLISDTLLQTIKSGDWNRAVLESPYRETSNIYDGSQFTADMAIQNVIGDSFRGATWVSIHNGGGVGWGEVINGGFGLVLDGSKEAEQKLKNMLFFDVNNGIARRGWARNEEAIFTIKRAMNQNKSLKITLPNQVNDALIDGL
ncbi:hypothetical protein N9I77_03815, partial [Cyclobacteriaceae bacterium]|nr:hypothetical protein [Cyclobacteriaceae bacterium]